MKPIVVIIGPSGIGKTSNAKLLQQRYGFNQSITVTTADPRSDNDAKYYRYVNKTKFKKMIAEGKLLEWDQFGNNYYGTPLEETKKIGGPSCTGLVICSSPRGYPQILAKIKNVIGIALLPKPGYKVWLTKKLFKRGTNSKKDIVSRIKIMEDFIRQVKATGLPTVFTGPNQKSWNKAFEKIRKIITKATGHLSR